MGCRVTRTTSGGATIACTRRPDPVVKLPRCACGKPGVRRCCVLDRVQLVPGDGPNGQVCIVDRCNKPLCDACAIPTGPGREVCPDCQARGHRGRATSLPLSLPPLPEEP